MTNTKRIFRSIIFCLSGILLVGAAWSLYQRGFLVPWQNLGYPSGAYLSADKAVEILATNGRLIQVRTGGGQTWQTEVDWQDEDQSFWWAGFWYPDDDEIPGATAADFGCPFGLLAPPRPRWFRQSVDKATLSNCRLYVGETQLRVILFEDGNVWVWAYQKFLQEDNNRFLALWLILGGLAGLGIGWLGVSIQRLKVVLAAGVLVLGALGISWWMMGYWWNPFSSCSAPINWLGRGEVESAWILPFGTDLIENQGRVCFSPSQYGKPRANNLHLQVYASGCYSSSCALVYERSGQMKIDQAAFEIHLSSRFVVKPLGSQRFGVRGACACTDDCGGAGLLEYETGTLQDGTYQVYLGETMIGSLAIPFTQKDLCLDAERPVKSGAGTEAYPLPYLSASPSAYPTPITVFPVPPAPYPEPQAPTSTPAVIEPVPTVETMPLSPIWYSPVITATLPISPVYSIVSGEWLSATRLQLVTHGFGAGSAGLFWAELDLASQPTITSFPASLTSRAYSASTQYSVECGSSLQMVDIVTGEVISQVELTLNMHASTNCSHYVSWAGDQAAAFFAGGDGHWHAYLWPTDGSAPFRVGAAVMQAIAPAWSPDLQYLAFLSLPEDASTGLALAIVDPQGRLVETIPVEGVVAGAELRWPSSQVIGIHSGEYSREPAWRFYTVPGAELLLTWTPGSRIVVDYSHQLPRLSPDRRWFLWEVNRRDVSGAWHLSYNLYDVQNHQEMLLYDRPWHGLSFGGWSPDGEALYLLHSQTGPDAVVDPELPYGLLAYHLDSGRYELLVEDAQAVTWDADSNNALVYFFYQEDESQGTLTAGIWNPALGQVLGVFPIKDAPTRVHLFLEQSMFQSYTPAAWSPDGQRVAFFTWNGDLILLDLNGQAQRLASQIGLRRSDFTRLLAWSPDGSRLFVSDRGTAWVVTIQE